MSEIIVQMNEEIIKGKIRELVRGSDLLSSTPRQIWLQRQLGLPQGGHRRGQLGQDHPAVP